MRRFLCLVALVVLSFSASASRAADPVLSDGSVSPVIGASWTTYTFTVFYADADGDAPSYVKLFINGAEYPVAMKSVVNNVSDYTQPVQYRIDVPGSTVYTPLVSNNYHFETKSTADAAVVKFPADSDLDGPLISEAPILSDGSVGGGARPGLPATYQVTYRDRDGDAPEPGFPIVWTGNSSGWQFTGGIASEVEPDVTLVTDSSKSWTPSQFQNQPLNWNTGKRIGLTDTIIDNTSNTLIVRGKLDSDADTAPVPGDKFQINELSARSTAIDYTAAAIVDDFAAYTPGAWAGKRLQIVSSNPDLLSGDAVATVFTVFGNTSNVLALSAREYPTADSDPAVTASGLVNGYAYSLSDILVDQAVDFNTNDNGFVTLRFQNSPGWIPGQFAGLPLQVLLGTGAGNSYTIWTNTSDTISFSNSSADFPPLGLDGSIVRIAGLTMVPTGDPPSPEDYAGFGGVGFGAAVPAGLGLGQHTARFMVSNNPTLLGERMNYQAYYPLRSADPLVGPRVLPGIPSLNSAPALRNATATPFKGTTQTAFDFSVDYMDPDGDAPGPHNGVVGNVTLFLEAPNGTRTYRASVDPVTHGSWPAGLWRTINSSVFQGFHFDAGTLSSGTYRYHFEASDGYRTTRFPSNPENDPAIVVNSQPVLSNPSVAPASGNTGTLFRFKVTYTDADNTQPSSIKLILNKNGVDQAPMALSKLDAGDNNFIDGAVYYVDTTLAAATYTYRFTASDDVEAAAPTFAQNGPVVRATNSAPVLLNGAVSPASSAFAGNNFTYSVRYHDPDGDAPNSVQLTIYATDGTTVLATKNLTQTNPLLTDYAAAGGVEYSYTGYSFAAGGRYYYQFTASDGLLAATGDTGKLVGPTVNFVPGLSSPSVTPGSGPSSGKFTYQVTYTDQSNVAPGAGGYVRVVVNGVSGQSTYQLAPTASSGWSTGVVYRAQVQLDPGVYTYHFEASDGLDPAPNTAELSGPTSVASPGVRDASVSPASGKSTDTYTYLVTVTNPDNTAPTEVKVFIDGSAEANGYTMAKVNPSASNYTSGVQYFYSTTLLPGVHSWYIRVKIAGQTVYIPDSAPGTPASGPTVNNPPVLTGAIVTPNFGRPSTDFTYSVLYKDADGVGPKPGGFVRVWISGVATPLLLAPHGSDWINGVSYSATTKLPGGSHTFYVEASDGIETTRLPGETGSFDGPRVNTAPTLTNGYVTPTTGGASTTFLYSVTYADVDNDAPAFNSVKVLIDGQPFTMTKLYSWDINYVDGAVYRYSTTLSPGTHNYKFQASDGVDLVSSDLVSGSPTVSSTGLTVNASPNPVTLGDVVTLSGQVTPARATQILLTFTRPSSSTFTRTVSTGASGAYSTEITADDVGQWVVTARDVNGDGTTVTLSPPLVVSSASLRVQGGVVDMISVPVATLTGDPATIFGADAARALHIVRWDPFTAAYQFYGQSAIFPVLAAGSGFWIKPDATVTLGLNGALSDQNQPVVVSVLPGWNQIGSGFVRAVNWGATKVRYQNQTVSLSQAAANGWVRDFAWGYNPGAKSYFLVRAPGGDVATLDPYRGYWFRAFVACDLLIQPTGAQ
ncbi:MAG: hypothetical protein IT209_13200 [Armatimonadetes bacterium]|nr:hypothetical protein [Armatimonadota bacterium]